MNQYADKIVSLLKNTSVEEGSTLWDVFGSDNEFRSKNFSELRMKQFDSVFIKDI